MLALYAMQYRLGTPDTSVDPRLIARAKSPSADKILRTITQRDI